MIDPGHQLGVYLHLAQASARRRRLLVRDRLLILAGMVAVEMELPLLSAHCRHLVLEHNPNHLIGKWRTLEEARETADFATLLRQLQRRYPSERAERLLDNLQVELARERQTYFSDLEYGAALLGTTPAELHVRYGRNSRPNPPH